MSEQRQYAEKTEEKQRQQDEKNEKAHHEKNWDEKWRRDPLNSAVWALILIWGGLVLLASSLLPKPGLITDWWPFFFLGAGMILALEVVFRLLVAAYRAPVVGTIILAIVFVAIGLSGLKLENVWNYVWALALVALGLIILARGLFRRRQ